MIASTRVVVGLSGGVDSSVAAYLLKQQGYDVVGVFMRNWHDESVTIAGDCPWLEDSTDAMMVAQKLDIPFTVLDFSEAYKRRIVDYMFAEYEAGRTPNPDVLCNREIKFDLFLKAAEKLGAQYVATGHYCRKASHDNQGETIFQLLAGADPNKDQSYFLCQLSQAQLARALFPIGGILKPEVRRIAKELDLVTAEKKDSQGLCFIGKVHLPVFLQQQLKPREGDIVLIPPGAVSQPASGHAGLMHPNKLDDDRLDLLCAPHHVTPSMGVVVGRHQGAHYYTIGQRKGLQVGGMANPVYVMATDTLTNTIYCGMGGDHPGLFRSGLFVAENDVHWIREDLQLQPGQHVRYLARIRYRQPLSMATLIMRKKGLYILFDEPQKSIAAGQFVAWYDGEECIGSGVIAA